MRFLIALLLLAAVVAHGWMHCGQKSVYNLTEIETGMKNFYKDCNGENWPNPYRARWTNPKLCAWDGMERNTPAPFGTRCLTGGWHPPPPNGDGGLIMLEHLSGMAKGEIPKEFRSFQMIDFINLHNNSLHGPMWDTSTYCFIHRLDISYNAFSGVLPDTFLKGAVNHAELINLAHNKFSGSLPSTLSNLVSLTSLVLNTNEFSGALVDLSQSSKSLRHLDISNNKFTGLSDVSLLKNLAWFNAANNLLKGNLPELPSSVSRVLLGGNQFSGAVPESYAKLPKLRYFDCTGCTLTCSTPGMLNHVPYSTHCQDANHRRWPTTA